MNAKRSERFPLPIRCGNVVVKVYRVRAANGYTFFQVADHTEGKRKLRSFGKLDDAKREADRIARRLASGEVEALGMSGSERASFGRAMELLKSTGVPLELAAAHFAKAYQILGSDRIVEAAERLAKADPASLTRRTVAEVVIEFLKTKEGRGASTRYLSDLKSRLNRFADVFQTGIADVSAPDIQNWLDSMKQSPQSYTNNRRVVGTLYGFAVTRGYVHKEANPAEALERVKARGNGKIEVFTPAEMTALLGAAEPDFMPSLVIAGFCGLRSAELERLTWSDLDMAAGFVKVGADRAKTGSRRVVPLPENARQWLEPFAGRTGLIWTGNHDGLYAEQKRTAKRAAVSWKANGLRHSFASYRLAIDGDAGRVSGELGNSPTIVHRHYKELVSPSDANAWFSILPCESPNSVSLTRV